MSWRTRYDGRFAAAVTKILRHEGFFSDDPDDPGGATKYGVSLRWLRTLGSEGDFDGDGDTDRDDIWALSEADAVRLYHEKWYVAEGYGALHLVVGAKVFDLAVNMGAKPANRILQRAVRAAGGPLLVDDGRLGPNTRNGVSACAPGDLLIAARSEAAGHYRWLIEHRPVFEKYRAGWLNRAYS